MRSDGFVVDQVNRKYYFGNQSTNQTQIIIKDLTNDIHGAAKSLSFAQAGSAQPYLMANVPSGMYAFGEPSGIAGLADQTYLQINTPNKAAAINMQASSAIAALDVKGTSLHTNILDLLNLC